MQVDALAKSIKGVEQDVFLYLIQRTLVEARCELFLVFSLTHLLKVTLHADLRLVKHSYNDLLDEAQV